jgi:heterodisulfide reductase subunit C
MEKPIIFEEAMDLDFIHLIESIPGGDQIKDCIQCGSCSGSCPTCPYMDYSPRQLFAMIRAGMKEAVLESRTIWLCSSCYTCYVRCPQNIKITDIMYALKQIATREGHKSKGKAAQDMAKIFASLVNRYGRNHEPELMTRFLLKTNPLGMVDNAFVGLSLMLHRRMPGLPKRIKGIKQLRKIIKKAEEIEGY